MKPISTKHLNRFTPESTRDLPAPPVYFIATPTRASKALYTRECLQRGIRQFTRPLLLARVREVLRQLDIENRNDLLDLVDRVENVAADSPLSDADRSDWRALDLKMQEVDPHLRGMVAANQYFLEMAPAVAAQIYIQGWENRDAVFRRSQDGLMAEDLLEGKDGIPELELYEIWSEVMRLTYPSETDAKNSASPQSSPPGPVSSVAAGSAKSKSTAAAPPTAANGTSSASDTTETQD